jgi:hypothetical protein
MFEEDRGNLQWLLEIVAATGLLVGFAGGHPLAPFVVGVEGAGQEEDGDDSEEEFHKNREQGTGAMGAFRDSIPQ